MLALIKMKGENGHSDGKFYYLCELSHAERRYSESTEKKLAPLTNEEVEEQTWSYDKRLID